MTAIVYGIALALASGLAVGCGSAQSTPVSPAVPRVTVEAVTVEPETLSDEIELVGQLEADESVVIKSEIDGVIDTIAFDEGQEVTAGALLVRLRDDEQRARLAEAEANRVLAEHAYGRGRALGEEGVLAAAELDRLVATRDAARARVERARVDTRRTEIRAPFTGVLGRRRVSPGDRVTEDTPLVELAAVATLKLAFTVPEIAVREVRSGMAVGVGVAPWPDEVFPGEVYFVAPTLDPQNRRLLLKARVPNPDRRLRPGLFAKVHVETARREGALVVPDSALVRDVEGTFVWRVEPDATATRVPVELGLRRDGRVEVVSGLRPGDRVVSAGTHKVAPAQPLEVVSAARAPRSAGP